MKLGLALLILHDIVDDLVKNNILALTGDFIKPSLQQDLELVQLVKNHLEARGVNVDDNVERIIDILPITIKLFEHR